MAITLGADKAYDAEDFINELRSMRVTPHVAADTRPASSARVVAENIRRAMVGEPLLHLVDRARGY